MQNIITVKELMESIRYSGYMEDKQTKEVLNELIERKEETVPYLLELLRETVERTGDFIGNEREDYIYAILLLAQWKINQAFPILLSSIEVSEFREESFYDEFLIDNLSQILASLMDFQQVERVYALIENEKIDSFVRSSGIGAIGILCKQGILSRESVQAYFQRLLQGVLLDDSGEVYGSLVCMCMDLLCEDLLEDIKGAYGAERIDESYVVVASVEEHFAVAEGYIDESLVLITDIHEELSMEKHRISEEGRKFLERKLGSEKKVKKVETFIKKDVTERNAPCPCGSGKKYKKCCGK